jgi:type VI secretion system Hcp family effector
MKKGILIGAAALVLVVAAPLLWLILDNGGGDRRSAALVEPTAGAADVARFTATGEKSGVVTFPVQSFSWGLRVPTSAGIPTGQARRAPLELIKPIDASSPVLFTMLTTNENLTSAKLDLLNASGVVYVTYTFANAALANWDDGTSERLELTFQSFTTVLPKATRPAAPAGQVIGQVTAPSIGAGSMPIVDFATGVSSPRDPVSGQATGKRKHKPARFRRAIDGWGPAVLTKVGQVANLGTITVELQRPVDGSMKTYATYVYTNAVASSVDDAGAAGQGFATQELEFSFQKVEVKIGGAVAMDDWEAPVA